MERPSRWHDEMVKFERPQMEEAIERARVTLRDAVTGARSSLDRSLAGVRTSLGDTLRDRVAGPDAEERMQRWIDSDAPRWFGPDRPIQRVHADASMFIGGLRALLIQSLHPLAMAGVAQHSDYRNDPWGRLQRTTDFLASTTFGPIEEAQRAVDRVNKVHERVTGVASDGREYSARDPHLLEWVHVAEVDSFLTAHQMFGEKPLTDEECDEYVADMAVIARKFGVIDPPITRAGLTNRLRSYIPELRSTPESRDGAKYLLVTPPLDARSRAAYGLLAAATVSTLPLWSRPLLRLPWFPLTERTALRGLGQAVTRVVRWAMPTKPA